MLESVGSLGIDYLTPLCWSHSQQEEGGGGKLRARLSIDQK